MTKWEYILISPSKITACDLDSYGAVGWEVTITLPNGQVVLKRQMSPIEVIDTHAKDVHEEKNW